MKKKYTKDKIKDDLRLGKEFDVLALKYGKSKDYVKKIYNEMKKDGEDLLDRRSKEWNRIQVKLRPGISSEKLDKGVVLGEFKFK